MNLNLVDSQFICVRLSENAMARLQTIRQLSSQLKTPVFRSASTAPAASDVDPEWNNARPYSEIPGPKPLPIPKFGNFWRVLPFGSLGGKDLTQIHESLYSDYGPIVKFGGFGRPDMIMLYEAEDVEKLFRNESIWPTRPGSDTFIYYRGKIRQDVFQESAGVLSSQGEAWQKNRTAVNQPMMRPKNVLVYHNPIQKVASEFVERMKTLRDDKLELNSEFSNELNKWALESICLIALDTRLGCLVPDLKKDSDGQILIDAVEAMFSLFYKLDVLPSPWRYISTPAWRKYVKVMDAITDICLKHINRKIEEIQSRPPGDPEGQSVLEILLSGQGGKPVAISMAVDMMMAGIDTTSNSSAIVLYYLAKHPEIQEKVFQEVKKIMPNLNDDLPTNYSSSIPYLKACIKECQRMSPLAAGNARTLPKDLVLHGYKIPKGTDIAISNKLMCNLEKYFPKPNEFIPERWLKSEKESPLSASNTNPFVFLPFGFGPRMCIGRRLAELEMHTIITKVVRNFQISYNYGEMEWKSEILVTPKSPLKFKLVDRT